MSKILTTEEKIDYIYNNIRRNNRVGILKIFIKLSLLGIIIFGYYQIIQNFSKEEITKQISEQIGSIAEPIVKNMINNLGKQQKNTSQDTISNLIKNNPELIKKLQK